MAKMHRVRAMKSIMHEGVWRIPGKPSAVFECTSAWLQRFGQDVAELEILGDADESGQAAVDDAADAIPAGFPYQKLLRAGGLTTLSAIRSMSDLTAVPGIGDAKAEAIQAALGKLDGDVDDDGDDA